MAGRAINKELVLNVLNYWYSFDFLNQSKLIKELSRQEKEILESAREREGNRQIHSVTCKDVLEEGEDIPTKLPDLLEDRHMMCCGNITVYLGSVSKNYCIQTISSIVGGEQQREASLSKLAIASIQLTPEGIYIPNTFSLSPILWSMKTILSSSGEITPGMISKSNYDTDNRRYEEKMLDDTNMASNASLVKLTRSLIDDFVSDKGVIPERAMVSTEIILDYRMYKNEMERERREGDYHGLAHDYFASDMDMLINEIEKLSSAKSHSVKLMLMYYIQAAYDKSKVCDIRRNDLLGVRSDSDRQTQYKLLKGILDIRNTPLGKWPSKYSPFLMQQVAINLAVDEFHKKDTAFEDDCNLFSINGAPGTGKTTMIKEIIANNVVKRARIMASIKDPDDIFEECSFAEGPDPKDHSYTKYSKKYYRIKQNDYYQRLAWYGIVVTSNNNAAVENITTIIPNLDNLLEGLRPNDDDNKETVTGLNEVAELFLPLNGKEEYMIEKDWDRNISVNKKYHDIYFTPYSDRFLKQNTWGLISAPLGRRGNVNRFYKEVLSPMGFGPLNNKKGLGNRVADRKASYRKAQSDFINQYRKVEQMRDDIARVIDGFDDTSEVVRYLGEGNDRFAVFSKEVFKEFIDPEDPCNIKAHMLNPWCSEAYNREREKLFYYAMILNKEFVLASRACRNNLDLLGIAWHVNLKSRDYYEDRVVRMSDSDLEACMKPLLQTLQLLVPVISTTLASVGNYFRYVKEPDSIGTVIIDEAGQAAPQAALGSLWRAHKAIVIGDPKQIEPVVSDDVSLLKTAYGEDVFRCYSDPRLSVQSFADYLNQYGTYMTEREEGSDTSMWIGAPLTIHHRCISPMYDIANMLSYDETMKQVTPMPSKDTESKLTLKKTKWINISGVENGDNDHYVQAQGEKVIQLLEESFVNYYNEYDEMMDVIGEDAEESDKKEIETETELQGPDLFIISPFNTVVEGLTKYITENLDSPSYPCISEHREAVEDWLTDWRNPHIGTVHKFQGREANEVVMVLGCDTRSRFSANWVKTNVVNVAATRAKYRFVIIGDEKVWEGCFPVMQAKSIIDHWNLKKQD